MAPGASAPVRDALVGVPRASPRPSSAGSGSSRAGETDVVLAFGAFTLSRAQLVAAAVIAGLTWVNARGLREGSLLQNVLTVLKVGAIALLAVVAFSSGKGTLAHFVEAPAATRWGRRAWPSASSARSAWRCRRRSSPTTRGTR